MVAEGKRSATLGGTRTKNLPLKALKATLDLVANVRSRYYSETPSTTPSEPSSGSPSGASSSKYVKAMKFSF